MEKLKSQNLTILDIYTAHSLLLFHILQFTTMKSLKSNFQNICVNNWNIKSPIKGWLKFQLLYVFILALATQGTLNIYSGADLSSKLWDSMHSDIIKQEEKVKKRVPWKKLCQVHTPQLHQQQLSIPFPLGEQ